MLLLSLLILGKHSLSWSSVLIFEEPQWGKARAVLEWVSITSVDLLVIGEIGGAEVTTCSWGHRGRAWETQRNAALHIFYGGNVVASWGCCVALIDCSCQDQRVTQRQENSWGLRIPGTARSCWRLKGEGETKLFYSVTQKARCGTSSWMLSIFQIPTMFLPKV